LTDKPAKRDYENIPEYCSDDSLNHRLMALVRLEQFLDENSFTPGVIADLEEVATIARKSNEKRIYTVAELILQQSRKYL